MFLTHCEVRAQWVRLSPSLTGPIVTVGNILVLLSEEGVYRSTDSGFSWQESINGVPSSDCGWTHLLANNGDVYLTTDYCGFFYSGDSGNSWVNPGDKGLDFLFGENQPIGIGDTLYMGVASDGLWESGDKGANWYPTSKQTTNFGFLGDTNASVFSLDSNYLFVGSTPDGGVFRSPNTGVTWYQVLPLSDTGIVALTANGKYVIAGYWKTPGDVYFGVFRSTDWGDTWQLSSNNGLPNERIAILMTIGSTMFAGGDFGVFVSHDNGADWLSANGDTTLGTIYSFTVLGSYLYASGGGSTWRRPFSDFVQSSVAESSNSNSSSSLHLFPNPASDNLQILGAQSGEIHLFDLMGRERMNAITDGANATLDVSSLEPGMYFLREGNESAKVEIER